MSKFRDWYKTQKKQHLKRHQESIDRKSGVKFGTVFIKEMIPEGINFWKCGEGEHIVDIIPFEAGPNVPSGVPKGDIENVIDYFIHRSVGILEQSYVCPLCTWPDEGLECPICTYLAKYGKNHTKDERKNMSPKRRCAYLVWVHDTTKDEDMGLQIWEVAHWFFQDKIDTLAQKPKGGGIVMYAAIEKNIGKQIVFRRQGTGAENTQFLGHQFYDREADIPDRILEQSFPLDRAIKLRPTSEEIEKAFFEGKRPISELKHSQSEDEEEFDGGVSEGEDYSDNAPQNNGEGFYDDDREQTPPWEDEEPDEDAERAEAQERSYNEGTRSEPDEEPRPTRRPRSTRQQQPEQTQRREPPPRRLRQRQQQEEEEPQPEQRQRRGRSRINRRGRG